MVSSAVRALILIVLCSSPAFGAIALEGSFVTQNKVTARVDSMAIATTTGSDRLLVVLMASENGNAAFWLSGIDYGTRASPTALVFAARTTAAGAGFTEIWYAPDATIAGAGEDSIYFTWDLSCNSCEVMATVAMWSGVDQTELVTDSAEDSRASGNNDQIDSMTTDVNIGDLLIAVTMNGDAGNTHDWTKTNNWTEAYDISGTNMSGSGAHFIADNGTIDSVHVDPTGTKRASMTAACFRQLVVGGDELRQRRRRLMEQNSSIFGPLTESVIRAVWRFR